MLRADVDAGWLEAYVDAVRAVVALGRSVRVRVHVEGVVRARLCARFAPDTAAVVEVDDAVLPRKQRSDRTDLDTRRVGAVVAAHHGKQPSRIRKTALLDVLDP